MPRRDAPQDVRHDGLRLHNDERGTAVREKCDSAGVLVCKRKSRRRTTDAPRQTRNCGASVRERFCPRSYREKGNPATSTELRRNMDSEMVRGGAAPQGFAPHAPLCGSIFIWNHPNTHSPSYDRNRPLKRPTGGPHGRRTAVHPSSKTLLLQKGRIAPASSPSFAKGACVPLPAKKEDDFPDSSPREIFAASFESPYERQPSIFIRKRRSGEGAAIKKTNLTPRRTVAIAAESMRRKTIERFRDHRRPVSVPHRPPTMLRRAVGRVSRPHTGSSAPPHPTPAFPVVSLSRIRDRRRSRPYPCCRRPHRPAFPHRYPDSSYSLSFLFAETTIFAPHEQKRMIKKFYPPSKPGRSTPLIRMSGDRIAPRRTRQRPQHMTRRAAFHILTNLAFLAAAALHVAKHRNPYLGIVQKGTGGKSKVPAALSVLFLPATATSLASPGIDGAAFRDGTMALPHRAPHDRTLRRACIVKRLPALR